MYLTGTGKIARRKTIEDGIERNDKGETQWSCRTIDKSMPDVRIARQTTANGNVQRELRREFVTGKR